MDGNEPETERQRRLALLLEIYESVRKLCTNEHAAIQLTPAVRHIFLMGHVLHYNRIRGVALGERRLCRLAHEVVPALENQDTESQVA